MDDLGQWVWVWSQCEAFRFSIMVKSLRVHLPETKIAAQWILSKDGTEIQLENVQIEKKKTFWFQAGAWAKVCVLSKRPHHHQGQLQNCFTYCHRNISRVRIAHIVEVLILYTGSHCWHSKHNYDPWHHQDKYTPRLFESRGPIGLESRTKRRTKVSYKGKVSTVQGDPNQNPLFQMAVPLKLCISDPMLVKP